MFALLLAPSVLAEQEYYTWVDEFGRVHNTVVNPSSEKETDEPSDAPVDKSEFLTEEDFQKQNAADRADNPEFYTWVDEQGRIHNQVKPEVVVTADEDEDTEQQQVTDHTLVMPLRVQPSVQSASCCESYAAYFKQTLAPLKSHVFTKPQFGPSFYTQAGNKAAWFFKLPNASSTAKTTEQATDPVLKLRLRDTDQPLAFIALNKHWQPLYFIPSLESQYFPATWRTIAMYETLIGIADDEVKAIVVYFPDGVENTANLEVRWLP